MMEFGASAEFAILSQSNSMAIGDCDGSYSKGTDSTNSTAVVTRHQQISLSLYWYLQCPAVFGPWRFVDRGISIWPTNCLFLCLEPYQYTQDMKRISAIVLERRGADYGALEFRRSVSSNTEPHSVFFGEAASCGGRRTVNQRQALTVAADMLVASARKAFDVILPSSFRLVLSIECLVRYLYKPRDTPLLLTQEVCIVNVQAITFSLGPRLKLIQCLDSQRNDESPSAGTMNKSPCLISSCCMELSAANLISASHCNFLFQHLSLCAGNSL